MASPLSRRAALRSLAVLPLGAAGLSMTASALAAQQPHMREALTHLQEAKKHLELAASDKGGHRAKAIKACDEAIEHTREGIQAGRP